MTTPINIPPSPESVRVRLTDLILEILDEPGSRRRLPVETPLRDLGMSSLKMANLMLRVEAAFDLNIPEDDIKPENFVSIATVEAMVIRLTSGVIV